MIKCSLEAYEKCKKKCHHCKTLDEAFFLEGSDCDKFNEEVLATPKTNADRIRAMSDEELAEFINRAKEPCDYCQLASVMGACTESLCDDAMLKWLKQPAEEE